MSDIFQGDPKIFMGDDGAYLKFVGGQCAMDGGIENLVTLSLFGGDWWGNDLFSDPDTHLNSDFEKTLSGPVTLSQLDDIEQAGERALINPAIGKAEFIASNPNGSQITYKGRVSPPGGNETEFSLINNFGNWINQTKNPAYRK